MDVNMMDRDPILLAPLWDLAVQLPLFVVLIIGMIWAFISWRKVSGPAMLAFTACAMLLLTSCAFPAILHWMLVPLMGEERVVDAWMSRLFSISWNVAIAVGIGALICAVFGARSPNRTWDDVASPTRPTSSEPDTHITS